MKKSDTWFHQVLHIDVLYMCCMSAGRSFTSTAMICMTVDKLVGTRACGIFGVHLISDGDGWLFYCGYCRWCEGGVTGAGDGDGSVFSCDVSWIRRTNYFLNERMIDVCRCSSRKRECNQLLSSR